ncbi:MAG: glycosyltransferase family 2 protein [Halioglobus sp.]
MHPPPPAPLSLSVSIVVHDSPLELLQQVLASLLRSARNAAAAGCLGQAVVDVLDNSQDPDLHRRVRDALSQLPSEDVVSVRYTRLPENRGFGAGHNAALDAVISDVHLVLNPDAVLEEDALRAGLARLAAAADIVLLSPRVRGVTGATEYLCRRYPSVLVLLLRGFAPQAIRRLFRKRLDHYEMRDLCTGEREVDIPLASGCFMLVRTAALRAIGGFDERYFLYFEDYDLSLRLASRGRLVFCPAMGIVHHGGYASGKGFRHVRYFIRSGARFFQDHGWRWI